MAWWRRDRLPWGQYRGRYGRRRGLGRGPRSTDGRTRRGQPRAHRPDALRPRKKDADRRALRGREISFEEVSLTEAPLEPLHREREDVDTIERAGVHGHHGAVGAFAAREGFDAAALAEEMMDDVAVELIIVEALFAAFELEL